MTMGSSLALAVCMPCEHEELNLDPGWSCEKSVVVVYTSSLSSRGVETGGRLESVDLLLFPCW